MKRHVLLRTYISVGIFIFLLITGTFLVKAIPFIKDVTYGKSEKEVRAGSESLPSYLRFDNFDPNARLGTRENPFIILEIVPYRGMGEIGYLIGGQEPVDPKISTYKNNMYGIFNGFANGAFWVSKVKKDKLTATEKANGGYEWKEYKLQHQYGYFEKVTDGTGLYDKVIKNGQVTFVKNREASGDYNWVEAENTEDFPTDYEADKVWMEDYTLDTSCWENIGDWLFENAELFKREVLNIPENELDDYHVRVVTITPEELNKNVAKFTKYYDLADKGKNNKVLTKDKNGEIDLIANADLISISPTTHSSGPESEKGVVWMWENYGRDQSGKLTTSDRFKKGFGENDLNWQTTMELFMKVGVVEDAAALVYDITCYDVPAGKSVSEVPSLISNEKQKGYSNNIYKLCLLLRQRDPVETYNLYFNTNGGQETPFVTETKVNGITTGSCNFQKNDLAKIYWNTYTFLPSFPDGTYPSYITQPKPDYRKYLVDLGCILGWEDKHDAVLRNTYSYNGTSDIVQYFSKTNYGLKEVRKTNTSISYSTEFYDWMEENAKKNNPGATRPVNATTSDAIEYILNIKRESNLKKSITVLDIEPCNDFTLTVYDIRRMIPYFSGIINIEQQTTAEFIGKIEDLNNIYDLIYIGTNTGKMNTVTKNGKVTTVYNDPMLDGLIYTHVGDRIIGYDSFKGILKESNKIVKAIDSIYINKDKSFIKEKILKGIDKLTKDKFDNMMKNADFYRFSGNDITSIKKEDLQEYVDGGFPILLENDLYQCNKDIIDDSSHLYNFIYHNKSKKELLNRKTLTEYSDQYLKARDNLAKLVARERLTVDLKKAPLEYDEGDKNTLLTDRILQYEFEIVPSSDADSNDNYQWNIYVDANADGRFVKRELILSGTAKAGESISSVKRLSDKYAGVVPWKLEVISKENKNIRTEKTGYAAFKVLMSEEEKLKTQIHVLQITSNNSTLNLEELLNPPSGKTSLFYKYTSNLDDFNINVKTISVSEFVNMYKGRGKAYDVNRPEETDNLYYMIDADGKKVPYDMLIFGFGDCYSDITNENGALYNVQAFIDSGRSVMFTYDTTSFVNLPDSEFNKLKTGFNYWGYGFNQYLRNRVGLDRFGVMKEPGDTTPYDSATMPSKVASGIYKNNRNLYPEIQGITYGILTAYGNPNSIEGIFSANKDYPVYTTGNDIINKKDIVPYYSYKVTKVNEGQITNYPYKIGNTINIAQTHTQYYQINMDDPEIVVWFCLSDNKEGNGPYSTSPNDVRNNYYIYSKGNIMYTGVGHSSIDRFYNINNVDETNAEEVKLFINTMIASYSAGITAPDIVITNEDAIQDSSREYTLYEDGESSDLAGVTKKIRFIADDRNLLSNRTIARIYYYDSSGNRLLANPVVKAMDGTPAERYGGTEAGYYVINGKEYYFDFPLDQFTEKGMASFTITATNEENITSSVKGTVLGRGLFDLD